MRTWLPTSGNLHVPGLSMGKIQQLDPHLTNMIAAGEVVERPMGIVKELVENAIDAQATRIIVSLQQGGIESIKVEDDGIGMDEVDARMAFERHATSKIKTSQELWNIKTMGFRGEALPSIASVSQVEMQTNDGGVGTQINIAWGSFIQQVPVACNQGTSIEVKSLFQKTPARLKHLKASNYEYTLVLDVIQKFAFAHPEITFELHHNDKLSFKSKGNNDLLSSILDVYGLDVAKSMLAISLADNDYTIKGFIAQPAINRANKYYIQIYINGRMIRNQKLTKAICDAYASYLPSGRYPVAILHIEMDYQLVDVNVHPSKWEIRLSKAKQLEELLATGLQAMLRHEFRPNIVTKIQSEERVEQPKFEFKAPAVEREKPMLMAEEKTVFEIKPAPIKTEVVELISQEMEQEESVITPSEIHPAWPTMQLIGQFAKRYVLTEGAEGLYLIDQHAAHERINFERLANALQQGNFHAKPLLLPLRFVVDAAFIDQLDRFNLILMGIGLHFDVFGSTTILVRELPSWLQDSDEKAVIEDIIELLKNEKTIDVVELRKHAIETMACHSSIRFNRTLSRLEMEQLLVQLQRCEQPFHCPHGRPTFILLGHSLLEKEFYRGG
ncbi:MAG: DNA mismatch repair endonuclease MutL [Erysipelotrichaceae bacterium]